jgi:diaminohydroxyphosphoribosylaminopyrimidine deaminase/5-amino-6-(5-phosphoribosylamino)uracil reductase
MRSTPQTGPESSACARLLTHAPRQRDGDRDVRREQALAHDPVSELAAMDRAISLAVLGLGRTSPNPSVGAVIIGPDGDIVGSGHTEPAGGPHAEVMALREAGARAEGGTAVVTLEPCNHTGRTGPCAEALIDAGIARVVIAIRDPNPVAAGGIERLRSAGLDVESGVRAAEARHALRYWLTAIDRQRPYVIWKYAATLDGRSAAADGSSRWITSPEARAEVHALRATVDAVIAGVDTVLADDPALTVRPSPDHEKLILELFGRHAVDVTTNSRINIEANSRIDTEANSRIDTGAAGGGGGPLRVIVDSRGRTPEGARVRTDQAAETWVATAAEVGADPDGRVDLVALLDRLYRRGVRSALLEGGPRLAGAFLRAGLVDEVVAYVAPKLLGAGPAALGPAGIAHIDEALNLEVRDVTRIGPDIRLTAVPKGAE